VANTLQEEARALGEPTRHRIFRYLADAPGPVDIAALTAHFVLHHNAIRQHLAKLVAAGLVTEDQAPSAGRGRPRLVYRANPNADSRWGVTGPYERLSVLLLEMLSTGGSANEVGRRSVLRAAPGRGTEADPVAAIADAMERRGFDPAVRRRGRRIEIVLHTCPYESAVLADSETVCAIHLGMAQGLATLGGEKVAIDELVPTDPRRANCMLRLHLQPADE
jgi:predicted ArsR family transcriptional regulator